MSRTDEAGGKLLPINFLRMCHHLLTLLGGILTTAWNFQPKSTYISSFIICVTFPSTILATGRPSLVNCVSLNKSSKLFWSGSSTAVLVGLQLVEEKDLRAIFRGRNTLYKYFRKIFAILEIEKALDHIGNFGCNRWWATTGSYFVNPPFPPESLIWYNFSFNALVQFILQSSSFVLYCRLHTTVLELVVIMHQWSTYQHFEWSNALNIKLWLNPNQIFCSSWWLLGNLR